jgi:hypothetical protein
MLDFKGAETKFTDMEADWILLDACTVPKLASFGIPSILGCTLGMKLEQPTLGDHQIRKTKERTQLCRVLCHSEIAPLLVSEYVLDYVRRMPNLRSNTGLELLELVARPSCFRIG